MDPSPPALHRYFFTKIELLAHTNSDVNNLNTLSATVSLGRHDALKNHYLVTLDVIIGTEPGKPTHYTGRFEVHGYFSVVENYPTDQHETLVGANGPAVLYSIIREMVANLTSRGPWPAIMLQVVTFVKSGKEEEDKTQVGKPMPHMIATK